MQLNAPQTETTSTSRRAKQVLKFHTAAKSTAFTLEKQSVWLQHGINDDTSEMIFINKLKLASLNEKWIQTSWLAGPMQPSQSSSDQYSW